MRVTVFGVGWSKGKAVLVFAVFCLFIFFIWRSVNSINRNLVISADLTALNFPGAVSVSDTESLSMLEDSLAGATVTDAPKPKKCKYKIIITWKTKTTFYLFDTPLWLFEPRTGKWLVLPDGGKCLENAVKQLEAKNPYGEFLTWSQTKEIFRMHDKARAVDVDSGMSFNVERRAGNNHADVQPLTARDSAIMKIIYGGKWSWKRKAIIVEVGGRRIAASMNGMPHGAGAISGNDFDGHFCMHFLDSRTHSNEENLAHQLMVWKAAGKLAEMLAGAAPERVVQVMLVAMEQSDAALAARLFQTPKGSNDKEVCDQLKKIKWMAVSKISSLRREKDICKFDMVVSYGLGDGTQVRNRRVTFILMKDQGLIPWKISRSTITELLNGQKMNGAGTPSSKDTLYSDWFIDTKM